MPSWGLTHPALLSAGGAPQAEQAPDLCGEGEQCQLDIDGPTGRLQQGGTGVHGRPFDCLAHLLVKQTQGRR